MDLGTNWKDFAERTGCSQFFKGQSKGTMG